MACSASVVRQIVPRRRTRGHEMRTRGRSGHGGCRLQWHEPPASNGNPSVPAPSRPRVVIVGAGFGGLSAARALAKAPVDLTVIDRRNFHLFQPLLYQVATAGLNP